MRKNEWFETKFLPSFEKNKLITITHKQADVFMRYINFTCSRLCYKGKYINLTIQLHPIPSSKFFSLYIADVKNNTSENDKKRQSIIYFMDKNTKAYQKAESSGNIAECSRLDSLMDALEKELATC